MTTKFYETVLNKKTILRLRKSRGLHELAELIERQNPPARLLTDLGIKKVTVQK